MWCLIHWPFPLPASAGIAFWAARKIPGEVHMVSLCLRQELALQSRHQLMWLLLPLWLLASSAAGAGSMHSDSLGRWAGNPLITIWACRPAISEHKVCRPHQRAPRATSWAPLIYSILLLLIDNFMCLPLLIEHIDFSYWVWIHFNFLFDFCFEFLFLLLKWVRTKYLC